MTSLALALNEFVDCMLVSNLLGEDALAIANLGCPVILLIAAVYVLLGNGGSIFYSLYLGKWDHKTAGKGFAFSMFLSAICGILFLVLGITLSDGLCSLLCPDAGLRTGFADYFRVLIYTAPILIVMLTFVCFLPPSGAPVIATIVNMVANGLNLVMDVVYIKVFGMGVEGAAYATITGYLVGALVMIVLIKKRHVKIYFMKFRFSDIKYVFTLVILGIPASVLQICFTIKYTVSNNLASQYGGKPGVVAFSLCLQTFSLASVFLLGVADTAQPLMALLSGQKDYRSENTVLKRSLRLQLIFACVLVALLEIVPQVVPAMYSITDEKVLEYGITGIRIFSLTYLFRGICIQFMRFFQVEKRHRYAFIISLCDGLLVLPLGFMLCSGYDINGIFIAYPISSAILLIFIIIYNTFLYNTNRNRYMNRLLIRKEEDGVKVLNLTITDNPEDISATSEKMTDFCTENDISMKLAYKVGLLCEEMAVYTNNHRKDKGDIDLMLRIMGDEITINFRSIGVPFNPTLSTEEDQMENLVMLRKVASNISFDYIMGMNNTQIVIK
ncbi:MAG: polysaccharide biosynthesis C-terminal domain-containing protein [Lachnospiraceae bacterium]|nr:polysaccharide biosynthesis C-terminal domain-containing protein [Lachnospiraceae bacterium]